MNKLISFSLYGNDPKYVRGLYENLKIKEEKQLYQNWKVVVFHDYTVKKEVLDYLKNHNVELIDMTESQIFATSWRFCAADLECERFIVRDSDSRISKREEEAVEKWIENDTILHIMRDHPHHGYVINGGMWGMKPVEGLDMRTAIIKYQGNITGQMVHSNERAAWWMKDMDFLRDVIYRLFGNPDQCTVHNAMDFMTRMPWKCEDWARNFPSPIGPDKHFVGEVFYFDENGNEQRGPQWQER